MRTAGYSEDWIQEAVFRATRRHWEEFYEELFGYDAKMRARITWEDSKEYAGRTSFATWRDPIMLFLVRIQKQRQFKRQHAALAEAEAQRMIAEGVETKLAQKRADEAAKRMIEDEQVRMAAAAALPMLAANPFPEAFADPWKKQQQQERRSEISSGFNPLRWVVKMLCTVLGGFILLAYLIPLLAPKAGISVPPEVTRFLEQDYFVWGYGGQFWALIIGAMIFKNAAVTRLFSSFSACAGAALLVFTVPIVAIVGEPQFTPQVAQFCGWILLALGLGLLRRFTRGGGTGVLMPF